MTIFQITNIREVIQQSVYLIGNARVNPCVIANPESHGVSLWQVLVIKKTASYSAHF
jgi:hypothetical protein